MTTPARTRIWCPNDVSLVDHCAGLCTACRPASWSPRRLRTPSGSGRSWLSPTAQVHAVAAVLLGAIAGVVFLALVYLAQQAMCAAHDHALRYCPGYTATDTQEPRP